MRGKCLFASDGQWSEQEAHKVTSGLRKCLEKQATDFCTLEKVPECIFIERYIETESWRLAIDIGSSVREPCRYIYICQR